MGVRIFPAGVEDGLEKGTEVSRAVQRRLSHQARRQTERRTRRRIKIYQLLQKAGLLPDGEIEKRHEGLAALDKDLQESNGNSAILPYRLRAEALDRRLEPYELGRAFYHLAQRRGFLSSRKAAVSEAAEKEEGTIKSEINDLRSSIEKNDARTLGEYFSRQDPHQKRIRERWTSQRMYEDEFDIICAGQKMHHPRILTERFVKELRRALFYQRPLKNQRHRIGDCELEPRRKRAAKALLLAPRFRMLQAVNNLHIPEDVNSDGRPLTDSKRQTLIEGLENEGDLRFAQVRRLLRLPRTLKFNLEEGGEKRLLGNRTASSLRGAFGDRWSAFSAEEQDRIVAELIGTGNDALAARRAREAWGCSEEEAEAVSRVRFEDGHGALSTRAMRKLMPLSKASALRERAAKSTRRNFRHLIPRTIYLRFATPFETSEIRLSKGP